MRLSIKIILNIHSIINFSIFSAHVFISQIMLITTSGDGKSGLHFHQYTHIGRIVF